MNSIKLTLRQQPNVPLEAETLSPDIFVEHNHDEICALPVYLGKKKCRVDDFFDVEGERSEILEISGNLEKIKWVGCGMTRGHITVTGDVGMHVGAYMAGGVIEVHGNASDWVGGEMSGGLIHVHGNAGGQIGAAYRGSLVGMQNGTIIIDGSVGNEVGMRMKRGIIVVQGPARDFTGLQMIGGSIFLLDGAGIRTGAWMKRGTIIAFKPLELSPTFLYDCSYNPVFLRIYYSYLEKLGIALPADAWKVNKKYQRYTGDRAIPGKGEILMWQ